MAVLGFVPVVGTIIDGYRIYNSVKEGDFIAAGAV